MNGEASRRLFLAVIVAGAGASLIALLAEHTPRPRLTFWLIVLASLAVGACYWLHTSCPACQARADRLRRRLGAYLVWGGNH